MEPSVRRSPRRRGPTSSRLRVGRRIRVGRRVRVGVAAGTLGIGAHVLCGGARLSCLSVPVAAALGMIAALFAGRVAGRSLASAAPIAATLSAGQLTMHLALSSRLLSLDLTPGPADAAGLLAAHGVAVVGLTVAMIGARNSLCLLSDLAARLRAWLRPPLVAPGCTPEAGTVPSSTVLPAAVPAYEADAHPRRGPPPTAAHRPVLCLT